MKLKEMISEKTIELCLCTDKEIKDKIDNNLKAMSIGGRRYAERLISMIIDPHKDECAGIRPYFELSTMMELSEYLSKNNPKFYESIANEIGLRGMNARINVVDLLKKAPDFGFISMFIPYNKLPPNK